MYIKISLDGGYIWFAPVVALEVSSTSQGEPSHHQKYEEQAGKNLYD